MSQRPARPAMRRRLNRRELRKLYHVLIEIARPLDRDDKLYMHAMAIAGFVVSGVMRDDDLRAVLSVFAPKLLEALERRKGGAWRRHCEAALVIIRHLLRHERRTVAEIAASTRH